MKRMAVLVCCAFAVPAWAADIGLGVSAESNDSTIYVPIDFGKSWRLEPFVNYAQTKTTQYGLSLQNRTLRLGAGIFGLKSLSESINVYYGGRLSYLDLRQDFIQPGGAGIIEGDGDGFRVAPTIGFEYSFNEHISVGAEAEWFYEERNLALGFEDERSGTDTRLILRFRF